MAIRGDSLMIRGGTVLKCARVARGYKQSDVADTMGISLKTIQRWESNKTDPGFTYAIWIITDVLKMTVADAMELAINESN
jgi:DNA-binding XRE family transcriptional regulator